MEISMIRRHAGAIAIAIYCQLLLVTRPAAMADELKVLSPTAMRTSVTELVPEFQKSSGHRITIAFGPAGALARRIREGEILDVGIVTGSQIDDLQKQDKIVPGTKVNLARVGVGMFTRKGMSKPEIRSVEDFKRALLAAKAIGHFDPATGAPSGIFAARLLSNLDIATELKPKIKMFPQGTPIYRAVERGEVDFALGQITEIVGQPNVLFLGPLPKEIQNYTLFAAGIATTSSQRDAGKSFISYLVTPAAASIMLAKGLDPASR
jgi:molybdate transport system substrate-binding protein